MLEADSCCKSSHSWRAPGSPRLICRTSNITNHLGVGNTSLSSSLSLFVFFPSLLPFFAVCLAVTFSPTRLLSCSLSNSSSLVCSLTRSAEKQVENTARRDGIVLFLWLCPEEITAVMMTLEMRGRYRFLLLFPLNSHFLSFLFLVCKYNCHSHTSAPPPCDSQNFQLLLLPLEGFRREGE